MVVPPLLHEVQHRLAQYYLGKLRAASAAVQNGRVSLSYGLALFDEEWLHIQHWQAVAVQYGEKQLEWTALCKAFPVEGYEVLRLRQPLQERVHWLKAALEAARQLHDTKAACAVLFRLFQTEVALSALDDAEVSVQQLRELAQTSNDRHSLGWAIYGAASIDEERGHYAEAREAYQQCLEIFQSLYAEADTSMTLLGLGSVALYLADYEEAQRYFHQHLAMAEASQRDSDICRALLAVAQGYIGLERFQKAEDYTQRAVALCRALGYQEMLCAALNTLGACAVEQGHLETARVVYEEGVQIARKIGVQRTLIHGLSSLGYVHFRLGDHETAIKHFQEALALAQQSGLPRFECNLLRHLANTHLTMGIVEAAERELCDGLRLAQSLDSDLQKMRTLATAVMLWQRKGFLEQAAIWVGLLVGNTDVDWPIFGPCCEALEKALGSERYQHLVSQGKLLNANTIVSEIIRLLT
jgi:tetratricopeptide (TPR) repeat protein